MLGKRHLENCYNQFVTKRTLPDGWYLGYMEACLINLGVIESKDNGLADYVKKTKGKFLFWGIEVKENRAQIILRLTKEYLKK